jgi:hypothetical protein
MQTLIRTYADGCERAAFDTDLTIAERYWTVRFLRVVASYDPASRADAVAGLYEYLTRSYGPGDEPGALDAFNAGFNRAVAILRNI